MLLVVLGIESVNTILIGVIDRLVRAPAILQNLVQEVRTACPKEEDITGASLSMLTYLWPITQQTLRLCPNNSGWWRFCGRPLYIGGNSCIYSAMGNVSVFDQLLSAPELPIVDNEETRTHPHLMSTTEMTISTISRRGLPFVLEEH